MTTARLPITQRERELGAIINAYNEVTERLKLSHDRLVGEVGRLRDQLEQKNRELARRERLAALGEMAAGVAHEIRNPLAGVQLYASLLVKDLADRDDARQLARKIADGVQTLEGVVGDVLAFAGQSEPQVTRVDLGGLIAECVATTAAAQSARQTTIQVDEGVERFTLLADPGQLQRAILNLLFNAIEAAGENGEVWISARGSAREGFCEIEVADNGSGIPPELRERVFNPFFTTRDSGTGLGLAIVHRIAEAHGGGVRAANGREGGAELTLTLPLWEEAQEDETPGHRSQ